MVQIVNILATGNIGKEIDLNQLSTDLAYSEYDPSSFPGLVFKTPNMGTILLFSSGKYSATGVESEESLRELEDKLFNELRDLGISLKEASRASVRNIVCTGDIDRDLNLSHLSVHLGVTNIEYEPEQSPFLVYRPKSENCVMTIASTGKTVITGLKTKEKAEQSFAYLVEEVSKMETTDDN
jgi:transcription initiation factor TFIID TATA-box-binding protein